MKKKNKIQLLSVSIFLSLTFSCSTFDGIDYSDSPSINFDWDTYSSDSITHSFFLAPLTKHYDTIFVKVATMGHLFDEARPFELKQLNADDADAAIAGVHYVSFDSEELKKNYFIPARAYHTTIPIVLIQDESLSLKTVRLKIGIKENEFYKPGVTEKSSYTIKTTAMGIKPPLWDTPNIIGYSWYYLFGDWGSVKMRFIIEASGFTDWYAEEIPGDVYFMFYVQRLTLEAFDVYNAQNPDNPLQEADGTLVEFPMM